MPESQLYLVTYSSKSMLIGPFPAEEVEQRARQGEFLDGCLVAEVTDNPRDNEKLNWKPLADFLSMRSAQDREMKSQVRSALVMSIVCGLALGFLAAWVTAEIMLYAQGENHMLPSDRSLFRLYLFLTYGLLTGSIVGCGSGIVLFKLFSRSRF